MKIKIVVERGDRKTEIPLTREECSAMYSAGFIIEDGWEDLEDNGIDKPFASLHAKFLHLVQDVIHGGRGHRWDANFKKTRPVKDVWLVKKPRWVKRNGI